MAAASARILILDDALPVIEALGAALDPPREVFTAAGGLAELEAAGRVLPGAVLLDSLLPDRSGLAILTALERCFPSLPVILMSIHGSEDVSVAAFRGGGAHDHLKKPIGSGKP